MDDQRSLNYSSSDSEDVNMESLEVSKIKVENSTANNVMVKTSLSKCSLCGKTLAIKDNPKLLECLHAACLSCVKSILIF